MHRFAIQKSYMAKPDELQRRWYHVDAEGETLGHIAVKVATVLMGKHKPTYTPHVDTGDYVVVINAGQIQATGKKDQQKVYQWYTGWPGGQKQRTLAQMRTARPEDILRLAVRRMLPKNRLGRTMLKKLKMYRGAEHPHAAQNPEPLDLGTGRKAKE